MERTAASPAISRVVWPVNPMARRAASTSAMPTMPSPSAMVAMPQPKIFPRWLSISFGMSFQCTCSIFVPNLRMYAMGSPSPSQRLPVSRLSPRAGESHASRTRSVRARLPVTGPCGSRSSWTPRSFARRRGSASFSRMLKIRSSSLSAWPNGVEGSPSVVMTCHTPMSAAARIALMICAVTIRQGAAGSSRLAWAHQEVISMP